MEEKKKIKKVSNNTPAKVILILGLLLVLIPTGTLLYILLKAQSASSTPVQGERFDRYLDPAISSEDIESLKTSILGLDGVEKLSVDIKSGTLSVDIDTRDALSAEQISSIGDKAFEIVTNKLPIEKYFTNDTAKRMYDLNIVAYNYFNIPDNIIAYTVTKNGTSEEVFRDFLNEANDPDYVASLEKDE